MKILILTQWYPPEPGLLMQELAQTLLAWGHEVTVLTGFPNYPSGVLYPGYRQRLRHRETLAGVPVVRVPLYPDHSRSGVRRVLNYLSFAISSVILGIWLAPRPDIIFVYHPPLTIGIPAYVLSRLWRIPFVLQIQDMWPETLSATGMLTNAWLLGWVDRFAQWVYAKADAILVISPGFRKNLLNKGVPDKKVHVISNWVGPQHDMIVDDDLELTARLGLVGHFNVMFAGNIGEAQGLESVIEAAALLVDLPEVQFVFVGDGVALPRLRQATQTKELSNVCFLGRYSEQTMPSLYTMADVLLVHLKNAPLFEITIPHKILTYLGVGKPILAAVAGDAADVVVEAKAGIACPPEAPQALAEAVRCLYAMPAAARQVMGKHGIRAAQNTYSQAELIGQIETVLQEMALKKQYKR